MNKYEKIVLLTHYLRQMMERLAELRPENYTDQQAEALARLVLCLVSPAVATAFSRAAEIDINNVLDRTTTIIGVILEVAAHPELDFPTPPLTIEEINELDTAMVQPQVLITPPDYLLGRYRA